MIARAEEEIVGSLLRGLEVIDILRRSQEPLTLAEVAQPGRSRDDRLSG